jgi:murein DD-endopeptidase MepM/ murein hydrolase activator NlpD
MRRHPVTKKRSFHNGIDIKAKKGTNIVCPTDGVVVSAGYAGLLGRLVKIRTADGKVLYFGHMHKIKCSKGQRVKRGSVIGTVGRSGRATGPHLHFSVRSSGQYMDPMKYLAAR